MDSGTQPIPHCDLLAGVSSLRDEILTAVARVVDSGWYILGREVESFEQEFAEFHGGGFAIGVANGTDALCLALKACGLQPGDAVVTVSHTAVATVAAIEQGGFVPVLADIDPLRYTLCPQSLEVALRLARSAGLNVRAVVPVHLYGQPADMAAILEIAGKNGLKVVEDCSQAHGALYRGSMTGTLGDAAAWSLYPTKNLAAIGDGGIVLCRDASIAERLRMLRQYGWKRRNWSELPGVNSRLDELQAAILRVRLRRLAQDNALRSALAETYLQGLGELRICPWVSEDCRHVWHQFVICLKNRNSLIQTLDGKKISTMIHYPTPVHLQPAYLGRLCLADDLAHTVRIAGQVLSLPMFPGLTASQASRVIREVRQFSFEDDDS